MTQALQQWQNRIHQQGYQQGQQGFGQQGQQYGQQQGGVGTMASTQPVLWSEISQPGTYIEVSTGDLYRFPPQAILAGQSPVIHRESTRLVSAPEPQRLLPDGRGARARAAVAAAVEGRRQLLARIG